MKTVTTISSLQGPLVVNRSLSAGCLTVAKLVRATRARDTRFLFRFGDERYDVKQAIPYVVEQQADGSATAVFEPASIVAYGDTVEEAAESLPFVLLDVFDMLVDERHRLSEHLSRQLGVLSQYVARRR